MSRSTSRRSIVCKSARCLLRPNNFLPKHRSPQWRVIKQFKDTNDTPHVVIQNLREPSYKKSLSLQGLVTAGKYALQASPRPEAAPSLVQQHGAQRHEAD